MTTMNKTQAKKSGGVLFIRKEFELFIMEFCLIPCAKNKTAQSYAAQGFSKD